jgi:hypothetical protein
MIGQMAPNQKMPDIESPYAGQGGAGILPPKTIPADADWLMLKLLAIPQLVAPDWRIAADRC